MGIRLTIGGIKVECDTPDEALGMIRASGNEPKNAKSKPASHKKVNRQELLFANNPGRLLLFLRRSFPTSLSGIDLAQLLNCQPKSLPALFVSLRKRSKTCGYAFDELITRQQSYEKGKPISNYSLTEKGISDLPWPEMERKAISGEIIEDDFEVEKVEAPLF